MKRATVLAPADTRLARTFCWQPLGRALRQGTARRLTGGTPLPSGYSGGLRRNINAGGTGKRHQQSWPSSNICGTSITTPHVVSRGYGGTLKGSHRWQVDPSAPSVAAAGGG